MNEFKICDICNEQYVNELKESLSKIDQDAKIEIKCHGLCGIGARHVFVVVNGMPVIGETVAAVINQVETIIKKD